MEFFKRRTNIDFMGKRSRWYAISATLILASVALLLVRGLNFGIDFTGGVVVEVSFTQAADLDKVRGALAAQGYEEAVVQSFGTSKDVLIRLLPDGGKDVTAVSQGVLAAVKSYDPTAELRRTEVVGAQVGAELAEQGALAALFAFLFIMGYVALRFQWKLGVGSIVAAMHDPIIILGLFAATQMTFDLPALAAILAIVGYSLNDTVVVFDRIRERFVLTRKGHARRDHEPGHQRNAVAHLDDQRHDADRGAVTAADRGGHAARLLDRAPGRRPGRHVFVDLHREFDRARPQAHCARPAARAERKGRRRRHALRGMASARSFGRIRSASHD